MLRTKIGILFFTTLFLLSCKKDHIEAPVLPEKGNNADTTVVVDATIFTDLGLVNINTKADGNSWDTFSLSKIKDISGKSISYCHPDVEYFANGFNGYRFWMAFTPYFGIVGSSGDAVLYENPTIVASNDGVNWVEPLGIKNPIQPTPSLKDGLVKNNFDTVQGYWSDTDLNFHENKLDVFYRGSHVSLLSLTRIASNSSNNKSKLIKSATRTIVKQTSVNGVDWQPLEILYTSNEPETLNDNDVLSPSFVLVDGTWISYEVLLNKGRNEYKGEDNSYVLKRTSTDGLNFSTFFDSQIVHFQNKPWLIENQSHSPWHIHVCYVDGYYFLYIAVGRVKSYTSDDLYIAYSKDGVNFKVHPKPVVSGGVYRSCIFPMNTTSQFIEFGSIIGMKSGQFKYRKFKTNKNVLKKILG